MDKQAIEKINQQIYTQFPYLQGIVPKVREINKGINELYYQGSVLTANGVTLPIVVKVTADDQGNIQKMVASR
jgi:hypothetical protein